MESIEHYRVLAIFSKHYNKWMVHHGSDRVEYNSGSKNFKILCRLLGKDGINSYKEINLLLRDGEWNTKSVFAIKYMYEILSVVGVLGEDAVTQW